MPKALETFSKPASGHTSSLRLEDGSRVAVIGGGPAGSFYSYFLLDLAARVGLDIKVDIYERRDFSQPAPRGCNMCAGVISETLVQNLATEGITLPASVIRRGINSYVLHTDLGSQQINASYNEKRIATIFRGSGPRGVQDPDIQSFDGHLLGLAQNKGARILHQRVSGVERVDGRIQVETSSGEKEVYDLMAVAAGVNTAVLKLFDNLGPSKYNSPRTTKTALREYFLGREAIYKHLGDSLHVFLLDIPKLNFAMIVPKGDYVSVCLLGEDIDEDLLQAFLTAPEVKSCFPDEWRWDHPACQCSPLINVGGAVCSYTDRLIFVGDSGVTRLYKDGIGAAYRASKSAAACSVLEGISAEDFRRYYAPFCKRMERDNNYGKIIFFATHIIQKVRFSRKAVLRMVAAEQESPGSPPRMSSVLWDAFTGSSPYLDIFLRTLHPAFIGRFIWNMANVMVSNK